MLDTKTRAPQQHTQSQEPTSTPAGQPRWFRTTLVAIAVLVVAAVGYAVYQSATSSGDPAPQAFDSPAQAIVQSQIDAAAAVRGSEPNSVDVVNAEIARAAALAGLGTGPSSVEIVNAEIEKALASMSGPDLRAIALLRSEALQEQYFGSEPNPYAAISGPEDSIWQSTVPGYGERTPQEVLNLRGEALQEQWEQWQRNQATP